MGGILRVMLLLGICAVSSSPALAQRLEVGGSVGAGLAGSEGSLLTFAGGPVAGVHASVWWEDRLETAFRAVWRPTRPPTQPTNYGSVGGQRVGVFFRMSALRYSGMEFLYHARPGAKVRPFFGVGVGGITRTEHAVCEVAGCESILTWVSRYPRSSTLFDVIGIFGASGRIGEHVVLRGGLHFHRPGGEDLSMFELAFMAGYRF
jgi:hypothetical protein